MVKIYFLYPILNPVSPLIIKSTDAVSLDLFSITRAVFSSTFTFIISFGCMVIKEWFPPAIGARCKTISFLETFLSFTEKVPCSLLPNTKLFCGVMLVLEVTDLNMLHDAMEIIRTKMLVIFFIIIFFIETICFMVNDAVNFYHIKSEVASYYVLRQIKLVSKHHLKHVHFANLKKIQLLVFYIAVQLI